LFCWKNEEEEEEGGARRVELNSFLHHISHARENTYLSF
jgi:hypothetical protein